MRRTLLQIIFVCLCFCIILVACTPMGNDDLRPQISLPVRITPSPSMIAPLLPSATIAPFPSPTMSLVSTVTATPLPTINPLTISAIPTSPSDWSRYPEIPFKPIQNSTHYLAISNFQVFWHPDHPSTITFPASDWRFGSQSWSPDGGYLAIYGFGPDASLNSYETKVGIFSLATGEIEVLENTPEHSYSPIWSPDGRYLFYTAGEIFGPQHGFIYDLEARQPLFEFGPTVFLKIIGWSYDSTMVAFLRWDMDKEFADQSVLEIINITTREHQIYPKPFDNIWAGGSWFPIDNRLLIYGQNPLCGGDIPNIPLESAWFSTLDLLDFDTGEISRLRGADSIGTRCEVGEYGVGSRPWSSDGTIITYSLNGVLCFFTIETALETCPQELDNALVSAGYKGISIPSWSPDDQWIAFILDLLDVHGGYVALVRPDGTDLRIAPHATGPTGLSWSPVH